MDLHRLKEKLDLLQSNLEDAAIVNDVPTIKNCAAEIKLLAPIVKQLEVLDNIKINLAELELLKTNALPEMLELLEIEKLELTKQQETSKLKLEELLTASTSIDELIMEIRSGVGGEEAALFAKDLLKMYTRYALKQGWNVEVIDLSQSEKGGIKNVTLEVRGEQCFKLFSLESGIHRVQRIPSTEANGRIHTSAVGVSILPIPKAVDIDLQEKDIKMDVFRASGAGGQHVNKTESAVRLTHIPTGIVVNCQDTKHQKKNKDMAMQVLKAKLFAKKKEEQDRERNNLRQQCIIGTDRSDKMRTYNFPDNRVTDHRYNCSFYKLELILEGEMDSLLTKLLELDQKLKLSEI